MTNGTFTPTQQRILAMLADGTGHTAEELHSCLNDELQSTSAVKVHVCEIRKRLPADEDILCRDGFYRHIRVLSIRMDADVVR